MREKLNSNPLVQAAVIGVLLLGAAIFLLAGGGEEEAEEAGTTEATVTIAGTDVTGSADGATPGQAVEGAVDAAVDEAAAGSLADALALVNQAATDAPPPPKPVLNAWEANRTVVLLFVRDGGIDDRRVRLATGALDGFRNAAVFVVPAARISRYSAITRGVGVDRVPALVVVAPKSVEKSIPTASVSYGFQSRQSVAQAVIDAGYEGPTVDYHP